MAELPFVSPGPVEEDYPRTLAELEARFSSEEACRDYLRRLRWSGGFRCPRCRGERGWPTGRGWVMECASCHRQTSITAGTVFQDTHKPLVLWFRAMWWMTNQKPGASALGIQRAMGLGSYQTAWAWLHKLRRAMVRPGRDQLSGEVEVDEAFVGGIEPGGGRRHVGNKALVAIAAEVRGSGVGRIRMKRVRDSSASSLQPFIKSAVAPGNTVITDGLLSYVGLDSSGYRHDRRIILGSGLTADVVLPGVHRVASLLKRWLLGTHQGAVSREHLDYYLDEFTFRFNRRNSGSRGKLFHRLIQQAVLADPVPYAKLRAGTGRGPQPVVGT